MCAALTQKVDLYSEINLICPVFGAVGSSTGNNLFGFLYTGQDDAVGLSRKEERELKKALYASLQESRRPRTPLPEEESTGSRETPKLRKSTRTIFITNHYGVTPTERSNVSSTSMDESSQDSVMSSVSSSHESKK